MKKYLYLVCGSLLALAGCTRDADVEPARPVESGKVVLTGLSGEVTRTGFGEASEGVVPFRWSAGDCIWVGDVRASRSNPPAKSAPSFSNPSPKPIPTT